MDSSGTIRELKADEKLRPAEVLLTAAEAKSLKRVVKRDRHDQLKKLRARRATTAQKREEQRARARDHGNG